MAVKIWYKIEELEETSINFEQNKTVDDLKKAIIKNEPSALKDYTPSGISLKITKEGDSEIHIVPPRWIVQKVLQEHGNGFLCLIQKNEQPVTGAKRVRLSIDSLSDLKSIISADESPITLIPFVSRPQIEEKICELINLNLLRLIKKPSLQPQHYRGIAISGGSGSGKTRIGFEINNITERNETTKRIKDQLNATFEHIYINMNEIKTLLGLGLSDTDDNKYPSITKDIDEAYKMLTILIVTYFFAKAWSRTKIQNVMELTKDYDYHEVVELIHKEKRLETSSTLILVRQIDEFQTGNYWTVTLLRVIRSILVQVTPRTLIIPICTGTAPSRISKLGEAIFSVTQYVITNVHLSPMNFDDSMRHFTREL